MLMFRVSIHWVPWWGTYLGEAPNSIQFLLDSDKMLLPLESCWNRAFFPPFFFPGFSIHEEHRIQYLHRSWAERWLKQITRARVIMSLLVGYSHQQSKWRGRFLGQGSEWKGTVDKPQPGLDASSCRGYRPNLKAAINAEYCERVPEKASHVCPGVWEQCTWC